MKVTFVGSKVIDRVDRETGQKHNYMSLYYYGPGRDVNGCTVGALRIPLGSDLSAKVSKMDFSEPMEGEPVYEFDGRYSQLVDIDL
jgi:hypothetical protein